MSGTPEQPPKPAPGDPAMDDILASIRRILNEDDGPPVAGAPRNLMFVRLRVSPGNADLVQEAARLWTAYEVPVVLTFMRYYEGEIPTNTWPFPFWDRAFGECPEPEKWPAYIFKQHILNSYWCPTVPFTKAVMTCFKDNRLVSMCGGHLAGSCAACRNCETYYVQTMKRLRDE